MGEFVLLLPRTTPAQIIGDIWSVATPAPRRLRDVSQKPWNLPFRRHRQLAFGIGNRNGDGCYKTVRFVTGD